MNTKEYENLSFGSVKGPIGLTDEFYGSIMKSRKRSIFVTDSCLNDSAFTAVKKDAKCYTRNVKGVPFVNRRSTKGAPFSWKMVYRASPYKNLLSTPPDLRRVYVCNSEGKECYSEIQVVQVDLHKN